jgi:two-component system, cell cycle response regulator DivK
MLRLAHLEANLVYQKILIVDDDQDARGLLSVLLAGKGYEVKAVEDAERAIVLLYSFRAEIVLMDVGLPRMTGLQLTRLIRMTRAERIPIVAVSGGGTAHAVQDAYEAGCDGYIAKPVNNLTFASTVAQHFAIPRNNVSIKNEGPTVSNPRGTNDIPVSGKSLSSRQTAGAGQAGTRPSTF